MWGRKSSWQHSHERFPFEPRYLICHMLDLSCQIQSVSQDMWWWKQNPTTATRRFSGSAELIGMGGWCKNICEQLRSKKKLGPSLYSGGRKYCRRCEVFFENQGKKCPCCGAFLRLTPAERLFREKLDRWHSIRH